MAVVQGLGGAVSRLLHLTLRLVRNPLRLIQMIVYNILKYIVVVVTLASYLVQPIFKSGVGKNIKDFFCIPDATIRKRESDENLAGLGVRGQASNFNYKPRDINAPRTIKEHLRKLAWRCHRLIGLAVLVSLFLILSYLETPSHNAATPNIAAHAPNTEIQMPAKPADNGGAIKDGVPVDAAPDNSPAVVKHSKAMETISTDAKDPKVISDYANYLVDKLDLDEHSSWVVRSVQTYFDPYTYHGDAVYPDSSNPVDAQSLPSMKLADSKLVPGSGFKEVHSRGQNAIRQEIKHNKDMLLNDFNEKYEPDVKGKKKEELYASGKLPRPPKLGLPEGFVLRWPPERAKQVYDEIERERKFFEALDRIKEQEAALERLGAMEAHNKLNELTSGNLDDLDKRDAPQDDSAPADLPPGDVPKLQKRDSEGVEPSGEAVEISQNGETKETGVQLYQELTATYPLLKANKNPIRLISSGRGMLKKTASRSKDFMTNPDENLFIRGSDSFETSAVDLSAVLFIVSTTYSRLSHNNWALIDDWARFMTNGKGQSNGASLLVALHRPRGDESETIRRKLRGRGIFHHIQEDFGDSFEGQGGGANDTGEVPIIPDPAAVRYANALTWANDYNYAHFVLGGTPERHGINENGDDVDMFGNVIARNVQRHTVFAFIDDDAFVANVPQLVAQLKSHRLIADGIDLTARKPNLEQEKLLDKNMYLAFPSDPYSDWAFHNTTTYSKLYEEEKNLYGEATTTANMTLKYRQAYNASRPSDPWGDRERFLRNYKPEYRSDGSQMPIPTDWHEEHVEPSMVFPTSFGGGAIFMAPELSQKMANLACLRRSTADGFNNEMFKMARVGLREGGRPEPTWEEQLFHCARAHMPQLKLHVVPSFYSPVDGALYGKDDQSALHNDKTFGRELGRMHQYTGGTRPIMMHNHRTWHQFDAGSAHQVTDICGDDCFLQRYEFEDNWVLTNGHSLIHFPNGKGPGTNSMRIPRREFVKTANNALELETSGLVDKISHAFQPSVKKRGETYRQLLEFYESENMVVEQAPRPPGKHIDLLKLDERRQTFKLLDTSVAADGTVMQAYVRRRDHGRELFVDGPMAGRTSFQKRSEWMAVPEMVKGGLEGNERDLASEDKPPKHDEVVLLLWEPAEAPSKPSGITSGVPLISRGERFRLSSLFGVLFSLIWMCIKVSMAGFFLYAGYSIMQCSFAAGRRPQAKQVTPLLVPAALINAWSSMEQGGRNTCVLMFITTSLTSTYLGSAILGITYLYGTILVIVAVYVLAKAFFTLLFFVLSKILAPVVNLAARLKRVSAAIMARLTRNFGMPSFIRGWNNMFSFSFPSFFVSLTSCFSLPRFRTRDSSSSRGSNGRNGYNRRDSKRKDKARKSDDGYGDDDFSDVEDNNYISTLHYLAPPEDGESSVSVRRQPPPPANPYGRDKAE